MLGTERNYNMIILVRYSLLCLIEDDDYYYDGGGDG